MNCNECTMQMADLFDKNINGEILAGMKEHLAQCLDCAEEYRLSEEMYSLLKPKTLPGAPYLLKQNIVNQLIKDEAKVKNETSKVVWLSSGMKKILSIAAVLILAMLIIPFTFKSNVFVSNTAKAAEKFIQLSIDASQMVKSMVIKLKVKTIPRDNFDLIGTEYDMVDHTITKSFDPVKWRIDKGERVVVFDGNHQYLWKPVFEEGIKAGPHAGFVSWLKTLLDPQEILEKEQNVASERNSKVTLKRNGNEMLMTVTSNARGNFINDYCKNRTIEESDNRREYVFDNDTKLLKGLKIYIIQGKKETLILETEKIDYNTQIDPSLFAINLPVGVEWKEPTNNFTSETFKNIGSKRAAELFFQGIADYDWKLVGETCEFFNGSSKKVGDAKEYFGGLTVIKIGQPFKSGLYSGEFVPYEIKFKSGDVKKMNLALRNDNPNKVWRVDGGF